MEVRLANTLSGRKEPFVPLVPRKAGIYTCGPTVYDYAHIGNLRAYVFADILRRTLEANGYTVRHIVNITDIGHLQSDSDDGDDKMAIALKREGKPFTLEAMKEVAVFYRDRFVDDLKALNVKLPAAMPYASEHIAEDVALVSRLLNKSFAYRTSDGVYFDTARDPSYGKLIPGGIPDAPAASRIGENSEKKSQRDFALWKFAHEGGPGYDAPFGRGFPGWHIECSGMSMKYLGDTFDIHTGGIDHIPVHHTNEIAQSENATGKPLARYWMHNEFLNMGGEKISKSKGNTAHLKDIIEQGIDPLAYRYFLLGARYSSPVSFSIEALRAASQALSKIYAHARAARKAAGFFGRLLAKTDTGYRDRFLAAASDDLDTPKALAILWELIKDDAIPPAVKYKTLLAFDTILGLKMREHAKEKKQDVPKHIQDLIKERDLARAQKDWKKSDELRARLEQEGYSISDTPEGTVIQK